MPLEEKKLENKAIENKTGNLDEMFKELEGLIGEFDKGELTLEESFDQYKKGMDLLKKCNDVIESVEKKVLVLDENGEKHEF